MTTVTLELEDDTAELARQNARLARLTLSQWMARRIVGDKSGASEECDAMGYPVGWFERTQGSLADVKDFEEPADPPPPSVEPLEL